MIHPVPFKKGDKIALIAPSSPVADERIKPAINAVEALGLEAVVGKSCTSKNGFLAGEDTIRADDINMMFADKSIKGIFAMRGGYGSARILDLLDYKTIRKNPKVFAGYSDITALHVAFNQKCNLITFHAPMPASEFYEGVDEYTMSFFKRNIFCNDSLGIMENPKDQKIEILVKGNAEGRITGGNLTLLASSLGTKYEVNTKGKILFLEDVDEVPYRIDRMLLQLKQSGKFKDAVGIILGQWTRCEAKNKENSLELNEIFKQLIVTENKPTICNIACGHSTPTMTIPMGAFAKIDNDKFII